MRFATDGRYLDSNRAGFEVRGDQALASPQNAWAALESRLSNFVSALQRGVDPSYLHKINEDNGNPYSLSALSLDGGIDWIASHDTDYKEWLTTRGAPGLALLLELILPRIEAPTPEKTNRLRQHFIMLLSLPFIDWGTRSFIPAAIIEAAQSVRVQLAGIYEELATGYSAGRIDLPTVFRALITSIHEWSNQTAIYKYY